MLQSTIKRLIDIFIASSCLIVTLPVMAIVALAVRISMGAPVLFRQQRPGQHARLFTVYKFRTMNFARSSTGALLPDAERLTAVGKLIRFTSLDELPQLWNVLVGDMSLVGPRPLLRDYLPRYNARQRRRHEVKPGITGWAQINGRNAIDWERKLDLDVWYVDHWSVWLDLKIIRTTIVKVLLGSGIRQEGHATMPEFSGSPDETRSVP